MSSGPDPRQDPVSERSHGRPESTAGLAVSLRTPLPAELWCQRETALFVHGMASAEAAIERLALTVDGIAHDPLAARMPSPALGVGSRAAFWAIAPLAAHPRGGSATIGVRAQLAGGVAELELGSVELLGEPAPPAPAFAAGRGEDVVAICIATYNPPEALLNRQLDSLRGQDHGHWVCLISDDASDPEHFAALERAVGDDPRFLISRSERRLGAYENFHRALRMVPEDAAYVALCDQDDHWDPTKLSTLVGELGEARLVFSDMRIVDERGTLTSPTYWTKRRPNHTNFASLLLGNTVTGAASLFRRELLDDALPLPPRVGNLFHDHWLALVAAALGEIAYVPAPLYDYVQHDEAVIGHAGANRGVVGGGVLRRLRALRGRPRGRLRGEWRRIYFSELVRVQHCAAILRARFGARIGDSERRALALAAGVESSPLSAAWLAIRQLRRLWRDETLGSEAAMLRALAWRTAIGVRARKRSADPYDDADLPAGIVDEPAQI